MAVKTFTTGEVLTAADTNTYLNNGGLVYITDTSWTGVSSASQVTVSNVFSSTYANYRIIVEAYSNTSNALLSMRLRTTSDDALASYSRYGFYWTTSATNNTATGATVWNLINMSNSADYRANVAMDIMNPNVATGTGGFSQGNDLNTGLLSLLSYFKVTTTQYTGFSLFTGTGTFTGKVWVYGYRQA